MMRVVHGVPGFFVACLILAATAAVAAAQRAPVGPPIHRGGASAAQQQALRAAADYPDAAPRYHTRGTLMCSDCHISHASQTHANPALVSPLVERVPYAGGVNPKLLKSTDPLDLCLTCHDGQSFAPDVLGLDSNGLSERSAGHFADPEVVNMNGHSLGRGLPKGPSEYCFRCHFGSGDQKKVTCVDCHDPHGNGNARNLQWVSDPPSTPPLGLFSSPTAAGLERYARNQVGYGTLDNPSLREVSNMCLDCHHVFSGDHYVLAPHGSTGFVRHPSYDSERASTNRIKQGDTRGTTSSVRWNTGTGPGFDHTQRVRFVTAGATSYAASSIVNAESNGVFCLSCHKAHGSDQPFGLIFTAAPGGYAAGGCEQCHTATSGG